MATNKVIIIIGMHRSGTSLTASLLQKSGLDIGQNLLAPDKANTNGHFENIDFFYFHVNTLQKLAYHANGWDFIDIEKMNARITGNAQSIINKNQSSLWGWKDPRTTLFINFWAKLLPEANFLFIYRHPAEVVDSLFRRGDSILLENPELAIDAWAHYNNLVLKYYNLYKNRSFLVNTQTLIYNYPAFIKTINQAFDINLNPEIETLFDKALYKEFSEDDGLTKELYKIKPEVEHLYQALIASSWYPANAAPQTAVTISSAGANEYPSKEHFFSNWLNKYVDEPQLVYNSTTIQNSHIEKKIKPIMLSLFYKYLKVKTSH